MRVQKILCKKSFRDKIKNHRRAFVMPKRKKDEEKNELVEEFFRQNNPKDIKSMDDMYTAWKNFFAPAFQKMLDAEMDTKLGYSK